MVCDSPIHGVHRCNIVWCHSLPSPSVLRTSGFGKPDSDHSFLVEPGLEKCLYHVLRSGYIDITSLISLCYTHPLFPHLASAIVNTRFYDFRWLRTYNCEWQSQTTISPTKQATMMACLLHYHLDTSLLMRYLANNHTGAYCIIMDTICVLLQHKMPDRLIRNYVRVMTTGCPTRFASNSTHANALLH